MQVTATLEIESFMTLHTRHIAASTVASSNPEYSRDCHSNATDSVPTASVMKTDDLTGGLQQLSKRLDSLELSVRTQPLQRQPHPKGVPSDRNQRPPYQRSITCWNCGRQGHVARFCSASPILFHLTQATGKLNTLCTAGQVHEGSSKMAFTSNNAVPLHSVSPSPGLRLTVCINGASIPFIVDSGAAYSLLRSDVWDAINPENAQLTAWTGPNLIAVEGTQLQIQGQETVPLIISGVLFQTSVLISSSLTTDSFLGIDFLQANACSLDFCRNLISFPNVPLEVPLQQLCAPPTTIGVYTVSTINIPPMCEMEIPLRPAKDIGTDTRLLEADPSVRHGAVVSRSIVCQHAGLVYTRILNVREEPIRIRKDMQIASLDKVHLPTICSVSEAQAHQATNLQEQLASLVNDHEEQLTETQKKQLYDILHYGDIFAVDKRDLGRVSDITHQIHTGTARPIRQHARRLPISQRGECHDLLRDMLA